MELINTTSLNEARKQIEKSKKLNKNEKIAVLSQDDEFNRKIIETKKIDALIINEDYSKKDYLKQRNSSLNEVLCKLAAKNNISIATEIDKIIQKNNAEKAKSLARLAQNIELCKKTNAKLLFITKEHKNKNELASLLLTLKASTKQAQEAIKESF